ncbi:MAG TPA: hypothetical protein VFU21_00990, partial [Kofleriaceae bacterium]|nr:hypothetical protein [Kofleriaceae bacterium]
GEVRLRRDVAPSRQQIDDVLAWLRDRQVPVQATPRPLPPPPPPPVAVLQPLVGVEPPRRGTVWPLCAVSLGLAAAVIAAIIL